MGEWVSKMDMAIGHSDSRRVRTPELTKGPRRSLFGYRDDARRYPRANLTQDQLVEEVRNFVDAFYEPGELEEKIFPTTFQPQFAALVTGKGPVPQQLPTATSDD